MTDLVLADVSEFQGAIDWPTYAKTNPAAIARVCYGTSRLDKQFAANLLGMRQHVRARGWYQYVAAGQDVVAQAKAFAMLLGPLQPGEFVIADFEEGNRTQADYLAWAATVHGLIGGLEGEYSGLAFANQHLASFAGARLAWVAAYGQSEPGVAHQLWQFTDKRTFAGIASPCDASVFHGSIDQLLELINPTSQGGADMRVVINTDNGRVYLATGSLFWLETEVAVSDWCAVTGQLKPAPITTVALADMAHTNPKEPA